MGGVSLLRNADDTGFLTAAEVAGHSADPTQVSRCRPFAAASLRKMAAVSFRMGAAQPGTLLEEVALFVGRFTIGAECLPDSPHPRDGIKVGLVIQHPLDDVRNVVQRIG